jgi:hypothetical protein
VKQTLNKKMVAAGLLIAISCGCAKVSPATKEDLKFTKNSLCLKKVETLELGNGNTLDASTGVSGNSAKVTFYFPAYSESECVGGYFSKDNYRCLMDISDYLLRSCGGNDYQPAVFSISTPSQESREQILSYGCYRKCNE